MTEKKIEDLLKEKKIFEIVNPRLVECAPEISLREVIGLMQSRRSGYAVLVADRQVFGIVTETDIVLKVMGRNVDLDLPVSEFMTPSPAVLSPTDSVGAAIDLMAKKSIYHLPLVDKNRYLVGMLSVRTLIRFLAEFYPTEIYNLPPDPNQISSTAEGG